ncbi:N-formylglutamate amidohydrolase [Kiloniella laminariae]|uniref:N-formylglutamate amidohydrolase n=1 Tax=Kiloniella laminariae TaxID=454162 RepID=A0ABT4LID7_9PROT|nr:N-formylglutamate amidohydrolase [Kiloniella laminariae]MCZ4280869.1 N-formylglutamate amidohydrolase [Kiloniella laminariae]
MRTQLLALDEPAPVEIINPDSENPFLFLCDHATAFIPRSLEGLGVEEHHMKRHVAYDIGIKGVTEGLAAHFGSRAVFSNFSRLIVDPNRKLESDALMPVASDGCVVPWNKALSGEDRQARLDTFYWPYHNTITRTIDDMLDKGQVPVILSMHSMTHEMAGVPRPWPISVLWNQDPRLAQPFMTRIREAGILCGDNEPYSGRDGHGYTMATHADLRGLPNILIEVRQDLISDQSGIAQWTDILIDAFDEVLHCPTLQEVRRTA